MTFFFRDAENQIDLPCASQRCRSKFLGGWQRWLAWPLGTGKIFIAAGLNGLWRRQGSHDFPSFFPGFPINWILSQNNYAIKCCALLNVACWHVTEVLKCPPNKTVLFSGVSRRYFSCRHVTGKFVWPEE